MDWWSLVTALRSVTNLMKRVFSLAVLGFFCFVFLMIAYVSVARAESQIVVGLDGWQVPDKQVRYLPNYNPANPWQSTSQFITAKGSFTYGQAKFSGSAKMDSVSGSSISRLDVDYNLGTYGFRIGVLPYRISWCRTFDADSPWITEADAFCRSPILNEISRGAAGLQAYKSWLKGDYLIDGLIGFYQPMIDNQDHSLAAYKAVGRTVESDKYGVSVNVMQLSTGSQIRASWLHNYIAQNDDTGSHTAYQRRMDYDTYYLAGETTVKESLTVRLSVAAYVGSQTNPYYPYDWLGTSTTLEGIYAITPKDTIAGAVSNYTNDTKYAQTPNKVQTLNVPSYSVAWRHNFDDGYFGVLQATQSVDDYTLTSGANTLKEGVAVGLRLGKVF
jgi:hypothetical protein